MPTASLCSMVFLSWGTSQGIVHHPQFLLKVQLDCPPTSLIHFVQYLLSTVKVFLHITFIFSNVGTFFFALCSSKSSIVIVFFTCMCGSKTRTFLFPSLLATPRTPYVENWILQQLNQAAVTKGYDIMHPLHSATLSSTITGVRTVLKWHFRSSQNLLTWRSFAKSYVVSYPPSLYDLKYNKTTNVLNNW